MSTTLIVDLPHGEASVTEDSNKGDQGAALRERQGKGARYDSPAAPAHQLLLARRGTAYFTRVLNGISDAGLDMASAIPGWSRRHLVAYVAYQARQLALAIEAVHDGTPVPVLDAETMSQLVADGATLPAHALRNLVHHSEVHLNVSWRDLRAEAWDASINWSGKQVLLRATPWIRARSVWIHAVDLAGQGSFHDFPPSLLDVMMDDLERQEALGGGLVRRDSSDRWIVSPDATGASVSVHPRDIVRWLSGRGAMRLDAPTEVETEFDIWRWPPIESLLVNADDPFRDRNFSV